MYHTKSERQLEKEAQQRAQEQAARDFQNQADVRAQTNYEGNDCHDILFNVCEAIVYVVTCCGCCTSWDEYHDDG